MLQTLTEDVVKSSEIEGEIVDRGQVRSLIARRMGLEIGGLPNTDRHVEGVVEMMLERPRTTLRPSPQTDCSLGMLPCFRRDAAGRHRSASEPGAVLRLD